MEKMFKGLSVTGASGKMLASTERPVVWGKSLPSEHMYWKLGKSTKNKSKTSCCYFNHIPRQNIQNECSEIVL